MEKSWDRFPVTGCPDGARRDPAGSGGIAPVQFMVQVAASLTPRPRPDGPGGPTGREERRSSCATRASNATRVHGCRSRRPARRLTDLCGDGHVSHRLHDYAHVRMADCQISSRATGAIVAPSPAAEPAIASLAGVPPPRGRSPRVGGDRCCMRGVLRPGWTSYRGHAQPRADYTANRRKPAAVGSRRCQRAHAQPPTRSALG